MKEEDIVRFSEPTNEEREALMVVLEMRDNRALVSDLRFSNWRVPPTDVYLATELKVVDVLFINSPYAD